MLFLWLWFILTTKYALILFNPKNIFDSIVFHWTVCTLLLIIFRIHYPFCAMIPAKVFPFKTEQVMHVLMSSIWSCMKVWMHWNKSESGLTWTHLPCEYSSLCHSTQEYCLPCHKRQKFSHFVPIEILSELSRETMMAIVYKGRLYIQLWGLTYFFCNWGLIMVESTIGPLLILLTMFLFETVINLTTKSWAANEQMPPLRFFKYIWCQTLNIIMCKHEKFAGNGNSDLKKPWGGGPVKSIRESINGSTKWWLFTLI